MKSSHTSFIEYHADDYGLFLVQSRRILDCCDGGVLNAVSVMTNSPHLPECMEMLRPYQDQLDIAVHLNFMEGQAFCPGILTDSKGTFQTSFGSLLLHSFLFGRKKYHAAIKNEIRSQIFALLPYLEKRKSLRIDGHAHYHMVPVVFDALMEVIREENLSVSYIRIPYEHMGLYLRHWKNLNGFRFINLVKVLTLNLLAGRNYRKYRSFLEHLEHRVFLGVMFSGQMSFQNVLAVLPEAKRLAEQKGYGVEILAHPGGVYEPEDIKVLTQTDDIAFLTDPARRQEAAMFLRAKSNMLER